MKSWTMDSRFAKPARVIRVFLERTEEGLTLRLKLNHGPGRSDMEWCFRGVTQLRFRGESTELLELVLLQCENVASQGWEETRFRVKDYEEEFVSFFCTDIQEVGTSNG